MKANKKSFQKRLLNGKGFDLKAAGKFLIFCMFFSTMLAVSNPVNAGTVNEPFSISRANRIQIPNQPLRDRILR